MEKEYEIKRYVFIKKDGGKCTYIKLNDDCINDGQEAKGTYSSFTAKFGVGLPGAIFEIETTLNGKSISYSKKGVPASGVWKNQKQLVEWRSTQQAIDLAEKVKKEATSDIMLKVLEPIRMSYDQCRDRGERAALLARIISYITS